MLGQASLDDPPSLVRLRLLGVQRLELLIQSLQGQLPRPHLLAHLEYFLLARDDGGDERPDSLADPDGHEQADGEEAEEEGGELGRRHRLNPKDARQPGVTLVVSARRPERRGRDRSHQDREPGVGIQKLALGLSADWLTRRHRLTEPDDRVPELGTDVLPAHHGMIEERARVGHELGEGLHTLIALRAALGGGDSYSHFVTRSLNAQVSSFRQTRSAPYPTSAIQFPAGRTTGMATRGGSGSCATT